MLVDTRRFFTLLTFHFRNKTAEERRLDAKWNLATIAEDPKTDELTRRCLQRFVEKRLRAAA